MQSYDLSIVQGSFFNVPLTVSDVSGNPIDLTNYTVSGYLKYQYGDTGALANLNPMIQTPPTGGTISISMLGSVTQSLPISILVYDIRIYDTGMNPTTVFAGYANVSPDVTF